MKLSEKIKQLRNEANLTQPELAQKANIEQSYLSKLENEKGSPSFEVINKIAQVFNLKAIELIKVLDPQYVQEQLSHLPEIAIYSDNMKREQERTIKRWYLQSVLLIVFGVVFFFLGSRGMIFSKHMYEYYSAGLIEVGEPLEKYSSERISIINETLEEWGIRLKDNRKKLDEEYIKSGEYLGQSFTKDIGDTFVNNKAFQRRYFTLKHTSNIYPKTNDFLSLSGIASFLAGWFFMFFNFRNFRFNKKHK